MSENEYWKKIIVLADQKFPNRSLTLWIFYKAFCQKLSRYPASCYGRIFDRLYEGKLEIRHSVLIYLSRYLDQESEVIFFCYYQSNHSKVEAILLSAWSKDTTNVLAGLSSHYPFNAERQAGKL